MAHPQGGQVQVANHLKGAPPTPESAATLNARLRALGEQPLDDENIHSIVAHCPHKSFRIVQAKDLIEECLVKEGLVTHQFICSRNVGFDPLNRDSLGGNWGTVHELLATIKAVGWSDNETKDAVCAATTPGDTEVEAFNRRLVEGVPLAPVREHSILYSSFSCGHTNCGLSAIEAECPNSDPTISRGGKLSKGLIGETDPRFARAVGRGLYWKVLHHSVRAKYPDILPILIAAYNVYGSVQTKQSEVQGLMQMYKMSRQIALCGKEPDWEHIKNAVLKSQPPFADDIDFLAQFVICKAGRSDQNNALQRFVAAHRQHVPACRRIPGQVFGALADLPLTNLAWAMCLAAYTNPMDLKVQNTTSYFISETEIRSLSKKLNDSGTNTKSCVEAASQQGAEDVAAVIAEGKTVEACVAAETLLMQVRQGLKDAGVREEIHESNKLNKCYTLLSVGLSRFVLGKKAWEGRETKHLYGVAWRFLEDVQGAFPQMEPAKLSKGWPVSAHACVSQDATTTTSSMRVYDINAEGVVVDPLARLRAVGWEIGSVVGLKNVKDSFLTIVSVEKDTVRLKPLVAEAQASIAAEAQASTAITSEAQARLAEPAGAEHGLIVVVNLDDLVTQYEAKSKNDVKIRHPAWPAARLHAAVENIMFERAFLVLAACKVGQYCDRCFPPAEVVDCLTKPRKMAIAKAACPVGSLVLAPDSVKVNSCEAAELHNELWDKRAQVYKRPSAHPEFMFFLHPLVEEKRVGAFWFVEATPDRTLANMAPATASYTFTAGVELTAPRGVSLVARVPARTFTKSSSQSTLAELPEDAQQESARIPILMNCKAVAIGDVLYYHRPEAKAQKRERAPDPLTMAKVMKAQQK